MEGIALAAERAYERDLKIAWHGAGWNGAASAGKLKQFSHYIKHKDEAEGQNPDQMLGALFALQGMGAPMTIEKMN